MAKRGSVGFYDVMGDRMVIAEKNKGVYLNGKRIALSNSRAFDQIIGHIDPQYFPKIIQPPLYSLAKKFKSTDTLFCSVHEYLNVLTGTQTSSYVERFGRGII